MRGADVDGVYTLWSLPRPRRRPRLPPLERLLLAVSVLQWRALHGRALLYCDSAYASYLQRGGLLDLFDNVRHRHGRRRTRTRPEPSHVLVPRPPAGPAGRDRAVCGP